MSPLKFFRVHLCKPIATSSGTDAGIITSTDWDWRSHSYDITDVDLERVDFSKQYQVFVENFVLRQYTPAADSGALGINLAYTVSSPDLTEMSGFHNKEILDASPELVLLSGHITDYSREVSEGSIGIPCSIDFLRRRRLTINLNSLVGSKFLSETSPNNWDSATNMMDATYYRITLLFTQLPDSLQ